MEFLWTAPDGSIFPAEHWEAAGKARGVMIYLHGMGSAGQDFQSLAGQAAREGWEGFAINLRGQGRDPVRHRRGTELNLTQMERDIVAFAEEVIGRLPGLPVFWCGESMGALILAHLLASATFSTPAQGAIFSAPVVKLRKEMPPALRPLIRVVAKLVPRFRLPPSLFVTGSSEPVRVSRDEEYRERARAAAHFIEAFSIGFLNSLGDLMDASLGLAIRIKTPSLVLAGGQDVYVEVDRIREWFERLATPDKTLKIYPEAFHCLWNDLDRDWVVADVLAWLEAKTTLPDKIASSEQKSEKAA